MECRSLDRSSDLGKFSSLAVWLSLVSRDTDKFFMAHWPDLICWKKTLCLNLSLWPPRLALEDGSLSSTLVSHINFKKNPKNKSNCTEEKKMAIVTLCSDPYCHLDMIVSNIECPGGLEHMETLD